MIVGPSGERSERALLRPRRRGEPTMARLVADCRDMPSESGCTLTIAGEEAEVLEAAALHAVAVHGHQDGPELRDALRGMLKAEA